MLDLTEVAEHHALALFARALHRQVIEAEDDVLGRHDDRLAVGGAEDVVGRHHQHARLELRLQRQRHVDGHLVAVEVGVERSEEHTSELQSLMRISYAVFCLKKKITLRVQRHTAKDLWRTLSMTTHIT